MWRYLEPLTGFHVHDISSLADHMETVQLILLCYSIGILANHMRKSENHACSILYIYIMDYVHRHSGTGKLTSPRNREA